MKPLLQRINTTFPLYLTLLVNYPLLIGCLINSDLVDSRLLFINLLWQTLVVILYQILKSNWIYRVSIVFFALIALIESLHWIILKSALSTSSLFVISATNFEEASGFLNVKLNWRLLLILPLFFIIYKAWKHKPSFETKKYTTLFYGVFILFFFGFIIENSYNNRFVRKALPNFFKVSTTFVEQLHLFKEAKEGKRFIEVESTTSAKKRTVVLLLGESCSRNHMQLYNPALETTPLLSKRDDLIVFDNVVSSYSNTISSVLTSLSESALDNAIPIEKSIDLFDLTKTANYSTYWISNQSPIGIWENLVTVLARKADHSLFVNISSSNSMESTQTRSYDELLFSPLEKVLMKQEDSLKLIIVHTMGNHSVYRNRYPKEFDQFKGETYEQQIIAEYHNSMLYHDFVIDSMLNIIAKYDEEAIVLYTSDHGQNVYDEDGNLGHDYAGKLPKSNVEIPFFFWISKKEQANQKEFVGILKKHQHLPYVTDHLFHTLIELTAIKTPIFNPEKSIVNTSFDATRKRVLEDGYDYDE